MDSRNLASGFAHAHADTALAEADVDRIRTVVGCRCRQNLDAAAGKHFSVDAQINLRISGRNGFYGAAGFILAEDFSRFIIVRIKADSVGVVTRRS